MSKQKQNIIAAWIKCAPQKKKSRRKRKDGEFHKIISISIKYLFAVFLNLDKSNQCVSMNVPWKKREGEVGSWIVENSIYFRIKITSKMDGVYCTYRTTELRLKFVLYSS